MLTEEQSHNIKKDEDPALNALNKHLYEFWSKRLDTPLRTNIVFASGIAIEGRTQSGMLLLPTAEPNDVKLQPDDIFDAGLNLISTVSSMLLKVGASEVVDATTVLFAVIKAVSEGFKMNHEMQQRLMAAIGLLFLGPPQKGPAGDQ